MKKQLLTGGEYEFIPAIDTFKNFIDEFHLAFPSRAAELPQQRLSTQFTGIVN
ncbi:hypothetical protein [Acidobacterium sp. S8]|uniref:hypothetical protein n=1 Tax=Acidobacterium sp. S8 TaxID=1641854 RepID=UPI0020B162B2|nr:hypothetical protein [Acidobacterium sp. S8]